MPKLTVDGIEVEVPAGATILQACEAAGAEVPRFCYHERLSIAGNCRMCLVELEKSPKPIASCAMPAADGQVISTTSPKVKKAREGVMEFLLINHPLDCPICDQGGECDLQDQSLAYGKGHTRYHENKRAVTEKYMGPLIKTVMTRCIHCTRCVRFAEEIAGVEDIGAIGRGENMQITSYLEGAVASELSGNVIDLCPVGALTSKPYAFAARPWELKKTSGIDVMDAVGTNITFHARGTQVMRVTPRINDDVNEEWASDVTRFAVDGLMKRRLDAPYVRRDGRLVKASWAEAFAAIRDGIKGDRVAGLVGDLCAVEDMVAFRDLLAGFGPLRIEARQDGATVPATTRADYLFNSTLAGIETADVVLLIDCDPRHDAPLVNTRLRKATRTRKPSRVFALGTPVDLTYPVEWLAGGDLPQALFDAFAAAERSAVIVGMGADFAQARTLADRLNLTRDGWNGWNVLHTAAARVGALDLGLTTAGGVAGILADAHELDAVFLLGADEIDTSALADTFTVYIGTHGDAGVRYADVILPAAAYAEKPGTWVNLEGRVQRGNRAVFPPGEAREDWTIFRALSAVLGRPLPYDDVRALRARIAGEWPWLADEGVAANPLRRFAPPPPEEGEDRSFSFSGGGGGAADGGGLHPYGGARFYQSNPIARASDTMAECVRDIVDAAQPLLEAAE